MVVIEEILMTKCLLCNSARPVKFKTGRMVICQWCITHLTKKRKINPQWIIDDIKRHIKWELLSQPEFMLPDIHSLRKQVEDRVGKLGLFESFILKLFQPSSYREREEQISTEANTKYNYYAEMLDESVNNESEQILDQLLKSDGIPKFVGSLDKIQKKSIELGLINWKKESNRPSPDEWDRLRAGILHADKYTCCICGKSDVELHVHHIIPVSRNGTNAPVNLASVCHRCHQKLHPSITVSNLKGKKRKPIVRNNNGSDIVVVLDLETTGLNPHNGDRVIEVGAIKLKQGAVQNIFYSLINPGIQVPYFITSITGISNDMLDGHPRPVEVFQKLHDFIQSYPIVAHNATFERKFLLAEFRRINLEFSNKMYCTLRLARNRIKGLKNYKLETVYNKVSNKEFHSLIDINNVSVCLNTQYSRIDMKESMSRRHRALGDAEKTAVIWISLCSESTEEQSKIIIKCNCGKNFYINRSLIGRRIKCKACGDIMQVEESKTQSL